VAEVGRLTAHDDITSTNELAINIELRDRRPITVVTLVSTTTVSKRTHEYSLIEFLSSASSKTLYVFILSLGTSCKSRICITALEKPHWGVSGVPFMNRTKGVDLTAYRKHLSFATRIQRCSTYTVDRLPHIIRQ
jgi:hypothetical protein